MTAVKGWVSVFLRDIRGPRFHTVSLRVSTAFLREDQGPEGCDDLSMLMQAELGTEPEFSKSQGREGFLPLPFPQSRKAGDGIKNCMAWSKLFLTPAQFSPKNRVLLHCL